jgi:squalene cyclase
MVKRLSRDGLKAYHCCMRFYVYNKYWNGSFTQEKTMPKEILPSVTALAYVALLVLFSASAFAAEEDEIVTGCHFSNAEWGSDMIDRCIKDNQATRAVVLQYPEKYKRFLDRCRRGNANGWAWVKTCIDKDIEAELALADYPKDRAGLIAVCDAEFGRRGMVAVKDCVDQAIERFDSSKQN